MGTDEVRRVPVPTDGSLGRHWSDALAALGGLRITPHQGSVLRHDVDNVRVLGIDARLHAVAAAVTFPVAGADTRGANGARGTAVGAVVLRAAIDVIKGQGIV